MQRKLLDLSFSSISNNEFWRPVFLNSIFSNLEQRSSFLFLITTVTSATIGGVVAYYLFKRVDNREKIESLNKDLKKIGEDFRTRMSIIESENYEKISSLKNQETKIRRLTNCIKGEMEQYNRSYTSWGYSSYKTDMAKCKR